MLVRDFVKKDVLKSPPGISLRKAAELMADRGIGSIVIVKNGEAVGIITDRDILEVVAKAGKTDFGKVYVEEVMSKRIRSIPINAKLDKAIDMMLIYKIKKLPVTKDGQLVGIITSTDIMAEKPRVSRDLRVEKLREIYHRIRKN